MTEISQELVERMVALVRDLNADHVKYGAFDIEQNFVARTAAIVAELPAPVDPDLELAKTIAFEFGWGRVSDTANIATVLLAAIKRGRELASLARSANA